MKIILDDLRGTEIAALIQEHLAAMNSVSPPESKHALALESLRQPEISFWTVWQDSELLGCGALKELDSSHGEIKSMRTAAAHHRKGVASFVLEHILEIAKSRGYSRLSLETGEMPYFLPARQLYEQFGFGIGEPFGDYKPDANSVFMTKTL